MKITRQAYIIVFLFVIIVSALLEVYFRIMSEGDFYVGSATVLLAGATFSLVWSEIEASRKERARDHLKERLQDLYGPLMGLGDDFEKPLSHTTASQNQVHSTMANVRSVYSYLASNALKASLDLYYKKNYTAIDPPDSNLLRGLRTLFTADFEEITKEYRQLTISETEEKRREEISKASKGMKNPK